MGWRFLVVVCALGCGDNEKITANPPGPPIEPSIPPDIEAALEHDEQGRPVMIDTPSMTSSAEKIALVFDKDLDDPIARWGSCLERVTACYRANPGSPIAGCIDQIERCADDTGGKGCCAGACISEFKRQRGLGVTEDEAIDASFVKGHCLQGIAALRGAQ